MYEGELAYKSHSFWLNEAFRDIDGVVDRARETLKTVDTLY